MKKTKKVEKNAYFTALESASTEMVEEAYNNAESPVEKKKAAERILQERGLL